MRFFRVLLFVIPSVLSYLPVEFNLEPAGKFLRTSYCACLKCTGKWAKYKKTAFGQTPREGRTTAIDPRHFRRNEWFYISKDGLYFVLRRAEDTGSKVKGFHIDEYFERHILVKDCVEVVKLVWVEN